MALSNTAVPKYYGMFRDAVLRGEIPVNREVSMEMNRIDHLTRDIFMMIKRLRDGSDIVRMN